MNCGSGLRRVAGVIDEELLEESQKAELWDAATVLLLRMGRTTRRGRWPDGD